MSQFVLHLKWLGQAAKISNELDATMASLEFLISDVNVSEFEDGDNKVSARLHIPAYYIAEWMAENWWQLLYEPKKTEEDDRPEFLARHSMIAAQHGFALPGIHIIPTGRGISVFSRSRHVPLAGVRFRRSASMSMSQDKLAEVLEAFVSKCVDRLSQADVVGTLLSRAWEKVISTEEDEKQFCRLVGSMGIDPYNVDAEISEKLDWLHENLGERATRDFCLAASEDDFHDHFSAAKELSEALETTHTSRLEGLSNISFPQDLTGSPSWRRGVQAAKAIRQKLSYSVDDATVPDKLFDRLELSTRRNNQVHVVEHRINRPLVSASLSGFLERKAGDFKIALLPNHADQRRFAAARGIYLAWASEAESRRLVTGAVTRDQQASRAFAAELLVPAEYVKSQAQGGRLEIGALEEIARSRQASQEVVRLQAVNNQVRVSAY